MYAAVGRAGVDVALRGSGDGREVAANESAKDGVTAVGHEARVVLRGMVRQFKGTWKRRRRRTHGVLLVARLGVARLTVVETLDSERATVKSESVEVAVRGHHAEAEVGRSVEDSTRAGGWEKDALPQLHPLILSVRKDVSPISLPLDERDSFRVPNQRPARPLAVHAPPIPHLHEAVVRAREEKVVVRSGTERDGVNVVSVGVDAEDGAARFDVVAADHAV